MSPEEGFVPTFEFIGERNPALRHAAEIGGLTDQVRSKVEAGVESSGRRAAVRVPLDALPSNRAMPALRDHSLLARERAKLLAALEELSENGTRKPLVVVRDSCVTNELLVRSFREALGEEGFRHYAQVWDVDWKAPDLGGLPEIPDHSVVWIGGSWDDTRDILPEAWESPFMKSLARLATGHGAPGSNARVGGTCFGNQLLADVIGRSGSVPCATIQGAAQFGCFLFSPEFAPGLPPHAVAAVSGIMDPEKPDRFSSWLTRTGHCVFDFLDDGSKSPVLGIVRDVSSKRCALWTSINGKFLGAQPHFEIRNSDMPELRKVLSDPAVIASLAKSYGEGIARIADSFPPKWRDGPPADADQAFYLPALAALAGDVAKERRGRSGDVRAERAKSYPHARDLMLRAVRAGMRAQDSANRELDFGAQRYRCIHRLIGSNIMVMRDLDDWQVSRGIAEVSEVLGLRDLASFLKDLTDVRKASGKGGVTSFLDAGAGDGTLIREIDEKRPKDSDVLVYGCGDRIYFDLLPAIKKLVASDPALRGMPTEFLTVYVQRAIDSYLLTRDIFRGDAQSMLRAFADSKDKNDPEDHLPVIREALFRTNVSPLTKITVSGMYSGESERPMDDASIRFASSEEGQQALLRLKAALLGPLGKDGPAQDQESQERLLRVIDGPYFERIWPGDFEAFHVPEQIGLPVGLKVASRSTSHIRARSLKSTIVAHLRRQADDLSVFFENGVHQSYTGVPRLREIRDAVREAGEGASALLIFDPFSNYVRSAAIMRGATPLLKEAVRANVREGCITLGNLDEAAEATFFRLESFARRTLAACVRRPAEDLKDVSGLLVKTVDLFLKTSHAAAGRKFDATERAAIESALVELVERACEASMANAERKRDSSGSLPVYADPKSSSDENGENLRAIFDSVVTFPKWLNVNAVRKY